jgi:biopolymer transport protein ExbD
MKLRLANAETESDDIDITPLIDVIFLLVLFFMLTTTFIEEAKVFQIVLPKADTPSIVSRDDTDSVSLTVNDEIYFRSATGDDEKIDNLELLVVKLSEREGSARKRPVIIRCDARCTYQQFVTVKNALKLAGVETIFEEVNLGGQ